MKKQLISILAAVSVIVTASAGLVQVSAANTTDAEIAVQTVTPGAGIELELGNITDNGDNTKTVEIIAKYIGFEYITSASPIIDFPVSLGLTAANCKNEAVLTGGQFITDRIAEGQISYSWATGDPEQSTNSVINKFKLTVPSDTPEFVVSLNSASQCEFLDTFDSWDTFSGDTFNSKVTVPGSKTVDPQAVNATMKHSQNDELSTENEAQYWLAEFTPTAAFNTLTVVATDVDGNTTAPVSKTETMVSGESSMFVQVLVKNVTKAVQSVVVTASVE